MTFAVRETSRSLGEPIGLFLFTYGPDSSDVYGYTSAEAPVVFNGLTYAPVPINRDTITASGSLDKATLNVKLSKALDIGALFTGFPPSHIVTLQIFQGHVGDSEFKPCWFGRLLSHAIEDNDIKFTCEPVSSALRRSGLRTNYQRTCQKALYGAKCGVPQASFTINKIAQAVASPFLTLPSGWNGAVSANKYLNGDIWWVNTAGRTEYRMILRIDSPTVLLLDGDCTSLTSGMTVSMSLACNHLMDDCSILFSNINNFGGQPWIPLKNPFGITNNFI